MSMQSKRDSSVGHISGVVAATVVVALVSANAAGGSEIPDRLQEALVVLAGVAALLWGISELLLREREHANNRARLERERVDERSLTDIRSSAHNATLLADQLKMISQRLDRLDGRTAAAIEDAHDAGFIGALGRRKS